MRTAHHIIISILIMNILSCTSETTTVISYNIRYDNQWDKENSWDTRKESIVRIFETYSPSFIGTQEGLAHQIDYMDSVLTEYDYIGVGREDGIKKGEFKNINVNIASLSIMTSLQGVIWFSIFEKSNLSAEEYLTEVMEFIIPMLE